MMSHKPAHLLVAALASFASLVSLPAFALPRCPNVVIVFDVSGSMFNNSTTQADGGVASRFVVGRDAIKALTSSPNSQLRYGLELFGLTADMGCGVSEATCSYPNPTTCQSVQADYGTSTSIGSVLDGITTGGSTPTGPAVVKARSRSDILDAQRGRYILLVTDGDPAGSCQPGDPFDYAIASLTDIRTDAGIKTFVLGFAGGSASQLNQMALAGGTARNGICNGANPCYYSASNATELKSALDAIIGAVGGELGTAGCDDTCYGQGCPAGSVCQKGASAPECVPDPCAQVSCPAGSVCANGACQTNCDSACGPTERCQNGTCVADTLCSPACQGTNQVCVGGTCVENLCSGQSYKLACPATHQCLRNACVLRPAGVAPDGGVLADGGRADGGSGGLVGAGGCCAGAPGPFTGLPLALTLLVLWRRSRRERAL